MIPCKLNCFLDKKLGFFPNFVYYISGLRHTVVFLCDFFVFFAGKALHANLTDSKDELDATKGEVLKSAVYI